ncbi:MAG: hypothetical protein QMC23_12310 [Rubritalea sp.]|jgi:negative regulator of replication initiation|tara:strand:+ start:1405 stop:1665 length:261 start_codon:yes stop_codon:yes gene_type:complete
MIKTQIQVPDELYKKAKEIAKAKGWSLAEVVRRGLEYMARTHPTEPAENWTLTVIDVRGFKPKTLEGLNAIIDEDREDQILSKLSK